VFGKSGVGKSSAVVDVPLYCMFNKISKRVTKNDWIINENKDNCSAEMEVFLRDKMYKISRKTTTFIKAGKKSGKPVYQGRTDVDFRVFRADGSEQELNAEERMSTDAEIRKLFGSPEDFIATSVAPQWKLLNIVESGGTDRQKLIGRYFDIDIFDKKHKLAREELRETNSRLKSITSGNLKDELEESEKKLKEVAKKIKKSRKVQESCEKKREKISKQIEKFRKKIVYVVSKESEESIRKKIEREEKVLSELQKKAKEYSDKVKAQRSLDMEHVWQCDELLRKADDLEKRAESLDRSCSCTHNSGCLLEGEINSLKKEAGQIRKSVDLSDDEISARMNKNSEIQKTIKERDKAYASSVSFSEEKLSQLERALESAVANKEQMQRNEDLEGEIEGLRVDLKAADLMLEKSRSEALLLSREFGAAESTYKTKKALADEYEALKVDYEAYDYFMRAMSKDGIVRQIISNNLGIINSEIEKILSHGVGFTVALESNEDGKAIDIFFKHERSPKRHIELCSGMEKTMAEVAIRAALVSVTTLPRSNIFVLDEAFGALDPEYMSGLTRILEYLKTLFETVIIITHKDELRDFVDHVIEVERDESGYARLT
jgi:DNA repair exonuclease SbcCD ATPase subunit